MNEVFVLTDGDRVISISEDREKLIEVTYRRRAVIGYEIKKWELI